MAAVFSHIQSAVSNNASDPGSATFGSAITEGSLLVATAMDRSGGTATNFNLSGSGWSRPIARTIEQSDGTYRRTLISWWKQAGAGESTTITVDDGTANVKDVVIDEFGTDVEVTWALEASASNDNGATGGASSIGTGTSGSAPTGNLLIVGVSDFKSSNAVADSPPADYTSENLTLAGTLTTSGFTRWISQAWVQDNGGSGTYSSTVEWNWTSGSNAGLAAGILVFSGTEASGSTGTLSSTLENATLAAAGTTTILGTVAQTIANTTSAIAAITTILATLGLTLADSTLAASGSVGSPVSGDVAETLEDATLSASGTTTVLGSVSLNLADTVLAATGTTTVLGSVNATIGNDTLAASGSVGSAVSGAVSETLDDATLAASGTTTILGTISVTADGMISTASGTTTILGTLAVTLGDATLNATGTSGTTPTGATWRFLRVWISKLGM